MKLSKNLGMLLLAIWLILYVLIALFSLGFQGLGLIMGLIAIAAVERFGFTPDHYIE